MKSYIDWAVKQGFAVIDVNLPKYITEDRPTRATSESHEEGQSAEDRTKEAETLLNYLWDNYIELNETTHVFFMGTNTGHGAIVNFIRAHEEQAQARITRAISFVQDVDFMSVRSPNNDMLPSWYYSHSLVFVTHEHSFWINDHKIRKRFGKLRKSSAGSISDMLAVHKDAVLEDLLKDTLDWQRPVSNDTVAKSPLIIDSLPSVSTPAPLSVVPGLPPVNNFAASNRRSPTKSAPVRSPRR